MVKMIVFILFIQNVIGDDWYSSQTGLCMFVNSFRGGDDDGNEQLYHCSKAKPMWKTESFTDPGSCESYVGCHIDDTVNVGEVCMGKECVWDFSACYCSKILDPFSLTYGCDDCKYETPSPTIYGECYNCNNENGASVFGIEDSSGACQCDVHFLEGDNCDNGVGSGVFDSGSVPFVKDSCHWDPQMNSYRKISCVNHQTLSVEWFSDGTCSQSVNGLDVQNGTCYYSCGTPISDYPTPNPTISPVDTEAPTPDPTTTDAPTLSPIVVNTNDLCDRTLLRQELNDTFYDVGDYQWIDDCIALLETETTQPNIVCGCIGKFWQSLANQYLNCYLSETYHGLTVWNFCRYTKYTQSCGSKCSVRRRQLQQEINHSRRRCVADSTFKLRWSEAVCQESATTDSDTDAPTIELTDAPIWPTDAPTMETTDVPVEPTYAPTIEPTDSPIEPTDAPTIEPTDAPIEPTAAPTVEPTDAPLEPSIKPTYAPTAEPTDSPTTAFPACIEKKTWDQSIASEICPSSSWGKTDRGYGSMFACDSDLQAKLEVSAANELFEQCSSYCIYDYEALLNGVQFGFIWKSSEGCWMSVTKYTCFKDHAYEVFEELQVTAASIC